MIAGPLYRDATIVTTLEELAAKIGSFDDPRRASMEWKQVFKLLQKTDVPAGRITHITGMRDRAQLAELIEQLRHPEVAPESSGDVSDEDCKKAYNAFKKRMKLTVLDEESKLGRSPLTKGSAASTPAIVPPGEWPEAVWQELTRQGKLHYIGDGFYELAKH